MNREKILVIFQVMLFVRLSTPASYAQNLLNNPESIVYDAARDRYIVSNWGDGTIVQIDDQGNQTYYSTALSEEYRVAGLYILEDTLLAAMGDAGDAGIAGFQLDSGELLFKIIIPGVGLPNDIVCDTNGVIYVTDYWGDHLYRIHERVPSLVLEEGLCNPNGMIYDEQNQRLLILSVMGAGSPIMAVDLDDLSLTTVVATGLHGIDGIARDDAGRVYVSEWGTDSIYRYDESFSTSPERFSTDHVDPADIYYDSVHGVLAVPNFSANSIDFVEIVTSVPEHEDWSLLKNIHIHQNHPNPFNAQTSIAFDLDRPTTISAWIFDALGKRVRTLVEEREYDTGSYRIQWDGMDDRGRRVPAGIYFYRFTSGNWSESNKMILTW